MQKHITNNSLKLTLFCGLTIAISACNSTDPSLGVESTAPNTATATNPITPATTGVQTNNLAPTVAANNVYFSPIVGAPVSSVTALSRRLSSAAPTNGIKLQPSASTTTNHEIRGYFSALSESGTITVIHVWDVFTPQGQRVHRIQGQEKITGASNDPWAAVPAATMEKIADTVLAQYASWRGTS